MARSPRLRGEISVDQIPCLTGEAAERHKLSKIFLALPKGLVARGQDSPARQGAVCCQLTETALPPGRVVFAAVSGCCLAVE